MCDDITEAHNEDLIKAGVLTRRSFSVLSGAALAACATTPADPKAVVERDVEITTPDGVCDAYFVAPAAGRHAAVLVWPDIGGLRPAFREMGKALAQSGYAVLTVNPYYREKKGVVFDATKASLGESIATLRPLMTNATGNPDNTKKDAIAAIAWLDKQKEVDTKKGVGTTGYCMGGPLVMRTMAAVPTRVASGCTFHGGGLATATPTSPHLLVPQMKAKAVLIAVAQNDDNNDKTVKEKVKAAFDAAGIANEVEVYPANHGWCVLDNGAVFNKAEADRAWGRMLATFEKAGMSSMKA